MIRSIYNKFFQKLKFSLPGFLALLPTISYASENIGVPEDYQVTFQDAATSNMADITWFHNSFLFPIILVITLFVTALLIYVMIRFSAKNNPNPSKTTHNSLIEVIWTVVPVIILIVIAIPSFRILYTQQDIPIDADLTIKATGYQWYWGYEYPDNDGMYFDSLPLRRRRIN